MMCGRVGGLIVGGCGQEDDAFIVSSGQANCKSGLVSNGVGVALRHLRNLTK